MEADMAVNMAKERARHRYVGLWQGGSGYAESSWADDAELFETVEQAAAVLQSRYLSGRTYPGDRTHKVMWITPAHRNGVQIALSNGRSELLRTPAVYEETYILLASRNMPLWYLEQHGEGAATHKLSIGPRGGTRIKRY